ncbi:MAG: peptidoglycan DD-metalloendopeptidase family protein [Oscillatoria sp. PMC 1068.18]|nr:peptidoglycan DD-metalloendopeptidase family protein [Oscillatoria sp. PMC 1076.18]MEC4990921.1 peptidoglycan DD-metalloendopeptidase family protein [Oscillatoria sp. PMC 1068.18]
MKRENIQKAKPVTSCPVNYCEALAKPSAKEHLVAPIAVNEGQRRARTSAAMIGLAISMGATGILLPKVGDEAIAAEGSLTNLNPRQETADTTQSQPIRAEVATSPAQQLSSEVIQPTVPVVKHEVQKGETLWQVSQNYKVEPAAKTDLATAVKPTQVPTATKKLQSESSSVNESVVIPRQIDQLQNRQQVAVNNLTRQRERLDSTLNQIEFEKPEKTAKVEQTETTKPVQPSNLAQNIAATESSNSVLIPVPTPGNNESSVSIPIPVELPGTAASNTPKEERATKLENDAVIIPIESAETTARGTTASQPTANSNNLGNPVVSTIPSPETTTAKVQQSVTESVTIPELVVEPQQTAAIQSFRPDEVTPPVVLAGEQKVYQVRPGDTLNAIARRHGLSAAELIQENNLANPHLIKVDQQLRIPRATTARNEDRDNVALIPGLTPIPDEPKSNSSQPRNNLSTVVPTEPLSDSSSTASNTQQSNNAPSLAAHLPPTQVQAYSESHASVEKLKADILRMRQEYQAEQQAEQGTTAANIRVEPPTTERNVASSAQVNSEWQSDRNRSPIQAESTPNLASRDRSPTQPELVFDQEQTELVVEEKQAELVVDQEQAEPVAEVQPEVQVEPAANNSDPRRERELVAVAPAPVEEYNPMLQIPVGEMVSPDLPPLAPPEEYLPDSPARFEGHIWPAKGVLTSGYGMRWGRMHKGIDIAGPVGTPIFASAPGEVVSAGWNSGGYGNLVEIKHPDGSLTRYAHNSKIIVRRGQNVTQGQLISEMGSTGYSTGPHLHFEVHPGGAGAANPMAFLPKRN